MIKNYLIIAWRILVKYKAYTIINIIGLGLGMACCLLIALFVHEEWNYDRFHANAEQIHRAYVKEDYGENEQFFNTVTPFPLGPVLKDNFQEIVAEVRISPSSTVVKVGNDQFSEQLMIVGQDFFEVFDFELVAGVEDQVLKQQKGLLITESLATRYFGNQNPLYQLVSIQIDQKFEGFEVVGILKDPPGNSGIQFDLLISDLNLPKFFSEYALTSAWFNVTPETYLLLKQGTDKQQLEDKFPTLFKTILGEEKYQNSQYHVGLQPLTSIHLDNDFPVGLASVSNPKYSYIISAAALLILLIACINYITLSVGRSLKRTREVGVRKIVGATRRQLIGQFVGESVVVTSLAALVAFWLSVVNIPLFNELSGKELSLDFNLFTTLLIVILIVVVGGFAGSYPAYLLSLFKPFDMLKAGHLGNTKQNTRKLLVGFQIFISAFLIASTLFMRQQLHFLQSKDLGFQKEQLAVIPMSASGTGDLVEEIKEGFSKAQQMEIELASLPGVVSSGATSHDFGSGNWTYIGYTDEQGSYRNFYLNVIDEQYLLTLSVDMVEGRNFSSQYPGDQKTGIIVNQAFAKAYGWEQPIGKRIPGKNFGQHQVIGVTRDFNYASLYNKVEPLVMVMDPLIIFEGSENHDISSSPLPKLMVRFAAGTLSETMEQVEQAWNRIVGWGSFEFTFVDQTINAQYQADQNLNKIINISTWLAIIIGSLGLYALASLAMQNRVKEIGIRRVLGATQSTLLLLLTKEYIYLVLTAFILSIPITWYLVNQWLSNFEFKIDLGMETFLLTGGVAIIVALSTIAYQAVKTAFLNPADTLRSE
ncbi:MAG: ABC transporter permease [Cyclobacteriaceae bacterium]|nr:MAG: ABC transporter permease [Cyclobacteriaceae bacterium]